MCFNSEVSLTTFLFGMLSLIVIIIINNDNKKPIIENKYLLIIISTTSMQLLEYFAWNNLDNKKIIRILSIIGLLLIGIQITLINLFLLEGKTRIIFLFYIFICVLIFIITEVPKINFDMKRGKNSHLIWYWLDLPLIWIIIALSFYIFPAIININKHFIFSISIIIMLIISLYFYFKYKTWGSMWCYFSNLIWIYLLFIVIKEKLRIKY